MAERITAVSSAHFDRVFDGRQPQFFSSATLHRSMGGHGLALPCWTLPLVLFHEPLPYDAQKIQVSPPSIASSDGPDPQDIKVTVKDAVGNTWMVQQDVVQNHQTLVDSIQDSADKARKCIRTMDFQEAITLLSTALEELWPCHRGMSLCFWLQLQLAHAHLRSAFIASDGSEASSLLDRALQIFNDCIANCHKNSPLLPFNRSLRFSSLVGIAWIYFFKGEIHQASSYLRASENVTVDREHLAQRGPSNLDLWFTSATFHAAWGDVTDAAGFMKKVGHVFECAEDIYQISIMDAQMNVLQGLYQPVLMLICEQLSERPLFNGELKGRVAEQMKQHFSGVIGDVWYVLGINSEALPAYEAAYSKDNLLLQSASLVGQGNCLMRMLNDSPIHENTFLEQAESFYKEAATIYEGLGHRTGKAIAHCNLGTLHYERKNFSQALHHYSIAKDESLGDLTGIQCRRAQLYMALGEYSTAHDLLQTSINNADKDKPVLFAWLCHNLGLCLLKCHFAKSRSDLFLDVIKSLTGGSKSLLEDAKEKLSQAVQKFNEVQSQFLSVNIASPLSISVFEDQKESFRLLEWCFALQGKAMEAFVWAERGRSKLLMLQSNWDDLVEAQASDENDELKNALYQLGSYRFEISNYDEAWQNLMSWKTCCSLQNTSVVVVEYTICKDLGILIYVIDGSHRPKVTCIAFADCDPEFDDSDKVAEYVNQTVHIITEDKGAGKDEVERRLMRLYDLLIRPVEKFLRHSSQLIIVPHEVLFKVPFAALVSSGASGKRENFLVEKYVISVAESLRSLIRSSLLQRQQCRRCGSGKQDDVTSSLIVGIKDHSKLGEATLQQAEVEAREVAGILERAVPYASEPVVLVGEAATKEAVVGCVEQADLVHLATHATITKRYEEGAILFAGGGRVSNVMSSGGTAGKVLEWPDAQQTVCRGGSTMSAAGVRNSYRRVLELEEMTNKVALDAQSLMKLRLKARLVVLSACETGRGVIAGEGVAGLGRAFSRAGAACCVLSLWRVSDVGARHFMQAFYTELAQRKTVALAMQSTMVHMIHHKADFGAHLWKVAHWAAFALFGFPSSCICY